MSGQRSTGDTGPDFSRPVIGSGLARRAMQTQLPPLTALRCFETAARRESFTLAAEELFLTPSAVSHQIKSLEAFLGNELFARVGRKMLLTDAGAAYYEAIRGAFKEILAATRAISEPKAGATLKVNVLPHFASVWLMPRLQHFLRAHPGLELQIFSDRRPVNFSESSIDCDIRYGHGRWPNLCSDLLLRDVLTPLCSPSMSGAADLAVPADILKHSLIYGNKRTNWDSWVAQYDVAGVEAANKIVFDRSNLAIDAAVAGLGIVLESLLLANHAVSTGALVAPLKQHCISVEGYYLVYPKSHAKIERVRLFRSWLAEMLEEKPTSLPSLPVLGRIGEKAARASMSADHRSGPVRPTNKLDTHSRRGVSKTNWSGSPSSPSDASRRGVYSVAGARIKF
jgi:LysR family glycine cleavage system transcriptional activator